MTPSALSPLANAIRFLAADAVQQANSGHPGMPMGMAEIALALWTRHLKHNPANPQWFDRDRVVVSNGHGSMLLYAALHLSGYDLPASELKNFRQMHAKTPGHPEVDVTPGVETTTGPLGQGITNAVGMALAEKLLAAEFNQEAQSLVDHYTYVLLGDGCLMEGISHEAASLAGVWGLGKLIALYDDNNISIDGQVGPWFGDDTPKRFEAYGWQVIRAVDGHDVDAVDAAIAEAKANTAQPTLICCKTVIGMGSLTRAGTAKAHGEALGAEEIANMRVALNWPYAPFEIPADVYAAWDGKTKGAASENAWNQTFAAMHQASPALAAEFTRRMKGELPANFAANAGNAVAQILAKAETIASRKASQNALTAFAPLLPEFLGGSADLTGSNLTNFAGSTALRTVPTFTPGNHINYGVREFGMAAIMNGIALHGGYLPYGGTFLTFSDYSRNAIRMAALMKRRVIHVFTHDSIGLGEDGPTHQPVEHAAALRVIPNLQVWRPCDATETAVAWQRAIEFQSGPSALLLSRQNLPAQAISAAQLPQIAQGGYVLKDAALGAPQAIIIATGSEVALAIAAQSSLAEAGIAVRVVSMPSTNVFEQQSAEYQASVLPRGVPRVAVEAGSTATWWKYVGLEGAVVGLDHFGESAPAPVLFKAFGITTEAVVAAVKKVLGN